MVTFRYATVADARAMLDLWRDADAEPSVTDDVESIERMLGRDAAAVTLAEVDGELAGTLITAFDGWRAAFYRLAVHPRHRRSGIALALVRRGEDRLRALGARRAAAIVMQTHADAVGFWQAAGYVHHDAVGRYTRDLRLPVGDTADAGEGCGQAAEC